MLPDDKVRAWMAALLVASAARADNPWERDVAECGRGSPSACLSAGWSFELGRGVSQDHARAEAYFARYVELRKRCARRRPSSAPLEDASFGT